MRCSDDSCNLPYIKNCSDSTSDELKDIYSILNNDDLEIGLRQKYLDTVSRNNLSLISLQSRQLWKNVIKNQQASALESNIINYFVFANGEWEQSLIDFVNNNIDTLSFNNDVFTNDFDDETQRIFFEKTVVESRLSNEAYRILLINVNWQYHNGFNQKNLADDKMHILIELNIIKFNKESLVDFRNYYKNHVDTFVLRNIEEIDIYDDNQIYDESELLNVLDGASSSANAVQTRIVDKIRNPISIIEKNYNAYLINYILNNKFSQKDLEYILSKYSKFASSTKKIITRIAERNLNVILTDKIYTDKFLINKLIINVNIPLSDRQLLFSRFVKEYDTNELGESLRVLNLDEFIEIINGRGSKRFLVNEVSTSLLNYFYDAHLISTFSVIDTGNVYKANANHKLNQIVLGDTNNFNH